MAYAIQQLKRIRDVLKKADPAELETLVKEGILATRRNGKHVLASQVYAELSPLITATRAKKPADFSAEDRTLVEIHDISVANMRGYEPQMKPWAGNNRSFQAQGASAPRAGGYYGRDNPNYGMLTDDNWLRDVTAIAMLFNMSGLGIVRKTVAELWRQYSDGDNPDLQFVTTPNGGALKFSKEAMDRIREMSALSPQAMVLWGMARNEQMFIDRAYSKYRDKSLEQTTPRTLPAPAKSVPEPAISPPPPVSPSAPSESTPHPNEPSVVTGEQAPAAVGEVQPYDHEQSPFIGDSSEPNPVKEEVEKILNEFHDAYLSALNTDDTSRSETKCAEAEKRLPAARELLSKLSRSQAQGLWEKYADFPATKDKLGVRTFADDAGPKEHKLDISEPSRLIDLLYAFSVEAKKKGVQAATKALPDYAFTLMDPITPLLTEKDGVLGFTDEGRKMFEEVRTKAGAKEATKLGRIANILCSTQIAKARQGLTPSAPPSASKSAPPVVLEEPNSGSPTLPS